MADEHNIERIGADAAITRARNNDFRKYPTPERDGDRLYPLATPGIRPSFQIAMTDTVYAIGSCFARNVERALEGAGLRVLSREFDLGEVGQSIEDPVNFFNKYSIHSVLNEIRWSLERETFPGADIIYPFGKDRFTDAQLGMSRLDFPVEMILAFRHRYLDAMTAVRDADIIMLTLGYVETWYDRKLDLYLNVIPPTQLIKAEPDRFEFRVLSYRDVLDGLEALHALLLRHRTKPLRMLVTVSPVPLLNTFRDMDILVANAYSKSVQRAALDEFLIGKEGVDYFPSYEFVTLSDPNVVWSRGDYRHVSPPVINRIMMNVLDHYVQDAGRAERPPSPDALLLSVRMMMKLENYDEILATAAKHRALADADVEVLLLEATAAKRADRLDASFEALDKAAKLSPSRHDALERMIMLCRPMRMKAEARALLTRHATTFPDRADFRDKVTWL